MDLIKELRRGNSNGEGCGWIGALCFVGICIYEIQTWFINADVAAK